MLGAFSWVGTMSKKVIDNNHLKEWSYLPSERDVSFRRINVENEEYVEICTDRWKY